MTTGLYAFRDIRLKKEGTPGTKEDTATQRLLGTLTAPMGGVILHRPKEERGSLASERRTVKIGEDLPITFEGDMLFDSIAYLLNMGIEAKATKDSGDDPYRWDFIPTMAAANTPGACTLQFGDNLAVYDIEYCVARELQISGVMNEVVKMRADMFGRNFEVGSFDPAIGDVTIDPASTEVGLCNKTLLYIDPCDGAPGRTVKSATLLGFTWTLGTGFRPVLHGGSNLFFDSIAQSPPKVTCAITAEFNTSMEAERVLYQAGTQRMFQILIGGTGVDWVKLNFSGVYTGWEPLSQEDGLEVVKFTVEGQYHMYLTSVFEVLVSNSIATLV